MPPVRVLLFIYSKYNIPVTHYPPNTAFYRGHTALTSPQGVGKRYRVSARTLCATRNPQGGGGCGVWADPLPLYLVFPLLLVKKIHAVHSCHIPRHSYP